MEQKIVFFIIAFLVGGAVFFTLGEMDLIGLSEEVQHETLSPYEPDMDLEFKRVNENEFYKTVLDFWETYRESKENHSMVLYLTQGAYLDKKLFFKTIKSNNLCSSLQSRYQDCGQREDTHIEYIPLPGVVKLEYKDETLHITSGSEYPINNRTRHASYIDFSGYSGKSDLIYTFPQLPSDARILSLSMKAALGSDFQLHINDYPCQKIKLHSNTEWDLSTCTHLINTSSGNNMTIEFKSKKAAEKFVGGGYLLMLYDTEISWTPSNKRYLPVMNGTIDYFASIHALGTSPSAEINLNYFAENNPNTEALYVQLNDNIEHEDTTPNNHGTYSKTFTSTDLAPGTNLLRIGRGKNPDLNYTIPVDVVLATDISGSMDCDMDHEHPQLCQFYGDYGNKTPACNDPGLIDENTQKLKLSTCFGKNLTDIIMDDYAGNKIGIVGFSTNASSYLNLTNDPNKIENKLDSLNASGETCIACAIARARKILNDSAKTRREIVLMTDGSATDCIEKAESCIIPEAEEQALEQARKAVAENIHIYTIGFNINEPRGRQLIKEIASIDSISHFKQGNTPQEVQQIYNDFAIEIASAKTIITENVQGYEGRFDTTAKIKHDSYIELTDPVSLSDNSSLRALVTQDIGCNDEFDLPDGSMMVLEDATLYILSDNQWVDRIELNGNLLFNRSNQSYLRSGDISKFRIPLAELHQSNEISVTLGNGKEPKSMCAHHNELHYTVSVPQSSLASPAPMTFSNARGCHWNVEFENRYYNLTLPASYSGNQQCTYTHENTYYSHEDSFQHTAFKLFEALDHNSDRIVDNSVKQIMLLGAKP
ncbi:MAG: vWA domain-containing protein [Nanobdellota archaeon]